MSQGVVDVTDELLLPSSQGSGRQALVARTQGSCELCSCLRSWETSGLEADGCTYHLPPTSLLWNPSITTRIFFFPELQFPMFVWNIKMSSSFFPPVDMLMFYYSYLSVCVCVENMYVGVHATARVEDRGEPYGLNSGHQALRKASLPLSHLDDPICRLKTWNVLNSN